MLRKKAKKEKTLKYQDKESFVLALITAGISSYSAVKPTFV